MGCSTKLNTPVSRAYHNLTAQYNIYFNAKESLKAGLARIDKTVPDDYTHFLPVYKTSNPDAAKAATAEMELAILKCSKLIALHSITQGPKRKSNTSERYKKFASKGEYNNWIDDSYILMGQASYYSHDYHRANENFNYVIRKFTDNPNRYVAYLWMAKTYSETGENDKAVEIFKLLERDGGFPKAAKKDLNIAQANYYVKNNQYEEAISNLKAALQSGFPRSEKLRYNYLLAQLLAATGKPEEAIKQYRRVLRLRPPFQMAFNAKISSLELTEGDNEEVKKQLSRLLQDENNLEYRDRIYFALGQIALKENRKSDALESFSLSVATSTSNYNQKALSGLTLARMLFEEEKYLLASAYYDTVVAVIDNNYPGYQEIMTRSSSLRRLADNLNTIQREDSLQNLALMPEAQRNAIINGIISKIQQEEAAKLAEANLEKTDQNYFRSQQYRPQIRIDDNQNLWYFYNPTTVGIGKSEFQRIWGKRRLEDNWRRKNKISVTADEMEQLAETVNEAVSTTVKKKAADPKTMEYYLQDIPLTDSLKKISTELIKSAFFNAGRIYETDFNNSQKAVETMEELNRRYPGSIYELPAWFELYQINNQLNNTQQADLYKDKVIKQYPDSKYAKYLLNPDYFKELEADHANAEKKYSEAFLSFKTFDYKNAKQLAGEALALKPDSNLLPKARFIEMVSEGSSQDRAQFIASLDRYISTYPKAPTKEYAVQIRDLLKTNALNDYQQMIAKGYINENIINDELKRTENKATDEFEGKFSYDENMFHYYVIAFSQDAPVDMNRLIYDIANYNLDYYTSTDFDIESVNLNPKTKMVVVRSMPDKEEGLIYFRSIIRKRGVFQSLKGIEYVNFVASSSNYRKVIEEKDYLDYLRFFTKNYSPYISSQIPADELPPPMELIAKARKEEEPAERGKFVLVKPSVSPDIPKDTYYFNNNDPHSFVISVKDSTFQMAPTIAKLTSYNADEAQGVKTDIKTAVIGGRKTLIVSGIQNSDLAMAYFRKIIQNRALFNDLENEDYLNFIISSNNMEVLKKKKNVEEYLSFFRENYLGAKPKITPPPAITPQAPASPLADYKGPYITGPGKDNLFVLVFQPAEIEGAKLISAFNTFNTANFGNLQIKISVEQLDDFRSMLLVTGLGEMTPALAYYRKAVADLTLLASLKNVNYRNFIISAENLPIFKKEKNLVQYLDFFNRIK